jgi:hypothetical protein
MRSLSMCNQPSSTQVSLVPPPCELLTTKEPSFKATRVRPPGTIWTVLPDRTKGRKSMWRGAMPDSTNVGQVDSDKRRLGDVVAGVGNQGLAEVFHLGLGGGWPDQHAVAPRAVHFLDDQLSEVVQRVFEVVFSRQT